MQNKIGKKTASRMWFGILLLFVVWIVSTLVISIVLQITSPDLFSLPWVSITINDIALYVLAMPVMLLVTKSLPNVQEIPRQKMKMGFFKFVFIFLFVLGATYLVNIITIVGVKEFLFLIFQRKPITGSPVEGLVSQPGLLQMIFFGAVVPAVGEEFIFRYWLRKKTRGSGDKIFIAISAVSFGLFHGNIDQALYAMAIGAVVAWVYVQTNNIVFPMLLHFMVNMMGIAVIPWVINSAGNVGIVLIFLFMILLIIMSIVVFFVFIGRVRRGFMPPAQNGWTKGTLFAPDPALAVPSVCEPPVHMPTVSATAMQKEAVPLTAVDILVSLSEISKKSQAADTGTTNALVSGTLPTATSAPQPVQAYQQQPQAYAANPYAQQYQQQYTQQPQAYAANPYAQQYAQQAQAYAANPYAQQYQQQYAQQAQAYAANPYAQQYQQQYTQQPQAYAATPYAQQYQQQYAQQAQAYAANPYAQQYQQQYAQQAQAYAANPYAQQYQQQYIQQPQAYAANPYAQQYQQQYAQQPQAYAANPYAQQYQQGMRPPMPPISSLTRKEKKALKKKQAAARGSLKIAFLNPGAIFYIIVVLLYISLTFILTTAPI